MQGTGLRIQKTALQAKGRQRRPLALLWLLRLGQWSPTYFCGDAEIPSPHSVPYKHQLLTNQVPVQSLVITPNRAWKSQSPGPIRLCGLCWVCGCGRAESSSATLTAVSCYLEAQWRAADRGFRSSGFNPGSTFDSLNTFGIFLSSSLKLGYELALPEGDYE